MYIGKPVRVVSFVMETDYPGQKKAWSPGHRSGFILLDDESFTVSSASPFDSQYFRYERGVLTRTVASDLGLGDSSAKTREVPMDYRTALFASLDECVSPGLGDVVSWILSEHSSKAPSPSVELTKLHVTAEFGGSWRALTRVTWLLPSLNGDGSTTRVLCRFSVLLPAQSRVGGTHLSLPQPQASLATTGSLTACECGVCDEPRVSRGSAARSASVAACSRGGFDPDSPQEAPLTTVGLDLRPL